MAGLSGIGRLLKTLGDDALVDSTELRKIVGSQVRLSSPQQSEIFEVLRNRSGNLSLQSIERGDVALDIRGASLFKGRREIRLPAAGSDMVPVGHIPYRGVPEGIDPSMVERGLQEFVKGPGVSQLRGAYAGVESSREMASTAMALRRASETAEPFHSTVYRGMGRWGSEDPSSRLAKVQNVNMYSLNKGDVFDLPPASFTSTPESKSLHDYFHGANMIVELPSARGLSVDHILPGKSNQAELVVAGQMRVKDITESGGKRRMQLEHAEPRRQRGSGARNLRHNLESTRGIYGMQNKF